MGKAVGVVIKESQRPCDFCHQSTNDEVSYGPLYKISSLTCHYFCVLLSTKMVQKGKDYVGVQGFMFKDIQAELQANKHSKCCYCKNTEATINCCYKSCRLKFHMPCGVKNGALSLFYKTFQTFCVKHRKNQSIPKHILTKQKFVQIKLEKLPSVLSDDVIQKLINNDKCIVKRKPDFTNDVCYICYENVVFDVPYDIFWPSCCKPTSWFHRRCLSKMALSAGSHFIRCPLCNNKSHFKEGLLKFGIFIPERDASWERENGAFTELLERPSNCTAVECSCPEGRTYQLNRWDMLYCKFCGSEAIHRRCIDYSPNYLCQSCKKITLDSNENNDTNVNETEENVSVDKNEVDNDSTDIEFIEPANKKPKLDLDSEDYNDDIYNSKTPDYESCTIKFNLTDSTKHDIIFNSPSMDSQVSDENQSMNESNIIRYSTIFGEDTSKKTIDSRTEKRQKKSQQIKNYSILKYLLNLGENYKGSTSTSDTFYVIKRKVKKCIITKSAADSNCDIKKYLTQIENREETIRKRIC